MLAAYIDTIARLAPAVEPTGARAQLVIVTTAALEARVQANNGIGQYVSVLAQLGVTGTTLATLITGTTGPSGTR